MMMLRRRVLGQMAGGVVVMTLPVAAWWYWARQKRQDDARAYQTAVRLPAASTQDTYDYLISEKCQAGDVLLFDRRCERCAAGPWAALSCLASRRLLTTTTRDGASSSLSASAGGASSGHGHRYDHMGLIVPGYIRHGADAYNPTNLLLLEATPSGIVARPLKERLERSASRSVLLLQLNCPGEQRRVVRNVGDDDTKESLLLSPMVQRTRQHVERELRQFRDRWTELGNEKGYKWIHSTVGLGGALAYGLGLRDYFPVSGPTSPSAYLVLQGLHKAAAAQNISEQENLQVKVEDFLRDDRLDEKNSVRLRPGWRFLAPITLKEVSRS